jgi:hypothetical protein
MTLAQQLIVNADDFGYGATANRRIIDCFEKNLISSATVMVNMPGFEEVVDWYQSGAEKTKLGVHLNLDEGPALSKQFRKQYGTGQLFYPGSVMRCDPVYLDTIRHELREQIEKMISAGIFPSHLDSHHHLHNHLPIARMVVSLAKEFQIKNIRMAGNVLFPSSPHKRVYRYLLNRFLFQRQLDGKVALFSYLDRFVSERPDVGGKLIELMVHPETDADYLMLLGQGYAEFLNKYELVCYPE